jgi:hypothetical protein
MIDGRVKLRNIMIGRAGMREAELKLLKNMQVDESNLMNQKQIFFGTLKLNGFTKTLKVLSEDQVSR